VAIDSVPFNLQRVGRLISFNAAFMFVRGGDQVLDTFDPPDAAREAAATLAEWHELWKADVLVGSEIADSALDVATFVLYRGGVLDDLLRRVARTYRPDLR